MPQLGTEFGLSAEQLGFINSMWFLGFPISMIIGGLVYHTVGPRIIMMIAFVMHTLGIVLTIYAGGFTGLLISTLFIGIGNGCTEAACNPMIADTYSGLKMNKMLNRFHMWFPGGIVVGSLISFHDRDGDGLAGPNLDYYDSNVDLCVPFLGTGFPETTSGRSHVAFENFKAMLTPLFIFIFLLHDIYCDF